MNRGQEERLWTMIVASPSRMLPMTSETISRRLEKGRGGRGAGEEGEVVENVVGGVVAHRRQAWHFHGERRVCFRGRIVGLSVLEALQETGQH